MMFPDDENVFMNNLGKINNVYKKYKIKIPFPKIMFHLYFVNLDGFLGVNDIS